MSFGGTLMKNSQLTQVRRVVFRWRRFMLCAALFVFISPSKARAQDSKVTEEPEVVDTTADWNEFDLRFTTFRIGAAFIYDYAAYQQNAAGKEQMTLAGVQLINKFQWRDFRFFANGRLRANKHIIWKVASMKDAATETWVFRETGLLIGVPRWHSEFFVGRSKEGYSLVKVENGYSVWSNERQMSLDLIPIMNDGIRWYGYLPKSRLFWSLGAFTDGIDENNRFATWDRQVSGRFGWRPIYSDATGTLLHFGINARYAKPDEGQIQVKSKPESNPAPNFIDTGVFASDRSTAVGWEAYYRKGAFMVNSEGNSYSFHSVQAGNPRYVGGDVEAVYVFTGEIRSYLSGNSVFWFVQPKKSVFKGGAGAFESASRYSSFNLNDGLQPGGRFWKLTSTLNWYLSNYLRLEAVYGYGVLDRFHLNGTTQFFQARFQFQIL
jgi:phosphate-selective porin OprO and OprP